MSLDKKLSRVENFVKFGFISDTLKSKSELIGSESVNCCPVESHNNLRKNASVILTLKYFYLKYFIPVRRKMSC